MAIRYHTDTQDIFSSGAEVLVNPVNCVGVMGKGLAKEFADRFPAIMPRYKYACQTNLLRPGTLLDIPLDSKTEQLQDDGDLHILNFPTKDHWRNPSRLDWIEDGLKALVLWLEEHPVKSIAIPQLGAGNGGLVWADVAKLCDQYLAPLASKIDIRVLGPGPVLQRQAPVKDINVAEFQGDFRLFSNMVPYPVVWGDAVTPARLWPAGEAAYVASKTLDPATREEVLSIYNKAEAEKPGSGGGAVKRFGRSAAMKAVLRPDLDAVKVGIMTEIVFDKIARHPIVARVLLKTGRGEIVEGNKWHDTFWGKALEDVPAKGIKAGDGRNELGKIYMKGRELLSIGKLPHPVEIAKAAAPKAASVEPPREVVNLKAVRRSMSDSLPEDVLDISRYGTARFADGTGLGNPFVMTTSGGKDGSREEVVQKFADYLATQLAKPGFPEWLAKTTSGKRLGCFCAPSACHGHVIEAAATAITQGRDPLQAIASFRGAAPLPDKRPITYAGIGSRETPPEDLEKMRQVAGILAKAGWVLRSGGADGADINFEKGCEAAGGAKEIYLPWRNFTARDDEAATGYKPVRKAGEVDTSPCKAAYAMAAEFHPKWAQLKDGPKSLHARNCYQVLGKKLNQPADVIICWTKDGLLDGGTAQALRIAGVRGVGIVNLGSPQYRGSTTQEIVAAAERIARDARARKVEATHNIEAAKLPEKKPAPAQLVPLAPMKNTGLMR